MSVIDNVTVVKVRSDVGDVDVVEYVSRVKFGYRVDWSKHRINCSDDVVNVFVKVKVSRKRQPQMFVSCHVRYVLSVECKC